MEINKKRCKKGFRKNRKTGECEPLLVDKNETTNQMNIQQNEPLTVEDNETTKTLEPSTNKSIFSFVNDVFSSPLSLNTNNTNVNSSPQKNPKQVRCKKGFRKNRKTGKCEPLLTVGHSPEFLPEEKHPKSSHKKTLKKVRCIRGYRKNRTTGKCEPFGQKNISIREDLDTTDEDETKTDVPITNNFLFSVPSSSSPSSSSSTPSSSSSSPQIVNEDVNILPPLPPHPQQPKEKKTDETNETDETFTYVKINSILPPRPPQTVTDKPENGSPENGSPENGSPNEGLPSPPPIPPPPEEYAYKGKYLNQNQKKNEIERENQKEAAETSPDDDNDNDIFSSLYPTLDDPKFSAKIANRREFFNTKYDGKIQDIKTHADMLCNAQYELMPHQLFVKNFLSFHTPYNSLLLYHGLGSGKTCSAIGVAEEMRGYMKQIGMENKILIVASPNVQQNFRLQLFDERKLHILSKSADVGVGATATAVAPQVNDEDIIWNIESCVSNSLLKEINPTQLKGIPREKVISQIDNIIHTYYEFMGYVQLANYISEMIKIPEALQNTMTETEKRNYEVTRIRKSFNNRLVIIDEVHNIRLTDENDNMKTATLLMKVAQYSENMRLLLLSATPMYNSYKEIIWITNLLNLNDKRSAIEVGDVFQSNGEFYVPKPPPVMVAKKGVAPPPPPPMKEHGRDLLVRKLTGYVSYVRGENPFVFPYRVYPNDFAPEHSLYGGLGGDTNGNGEPPNTPHYPTIQINGKTIVEPLRYVQVYLNQIVPRSPQEKVYRTFIDILRKKTETATSMSSSSSSPAPDRFMPTYENMDTFGFETLNKILEALNMVYPCYETDDNLDEKKVLNMVGKDGLNSVVSFDKKAVVKKDFKYKKGYARLFNSVNLEKYSCKIFNICNQVVRSKGIIIIYSNYIEGGIIPISLALEEMGYSRYCSTPSHNVNLFHPSTFENKKTKKDANNGKTAMDGTAEIVPPLVSKGKYIIISGDKTLSPSNGEDIKYATNPDNKYGDKVKIILISRAGAEGLDFKNIRQIHILEPWYNLNRIEQIIGRGVRNMSHCSLPFEERNVEIYMHSTILGGYGDKQTEEAADLYVYRMAEKKALQIGRITRLLKENSVDCILNIGQTNFTVDNLYKLTENQNVTLSLSSGKTIKYRIGDKPRTDICDYMDTCHNKCIISGNAVDVTADNTISTEEEEENKTNTITYNTYFAKSNINRIIERIRNIFREQSFYTRDKLIQNINVVKMYPIEEIFFALTILIQNKNEYLYDQYGRVGNLINRGIIYAFQPIELTDPNASLYERTVPIEYKRTSVYLEIPQKLPNAVEEEEATRVETAVVPSATKIHQDMTAVAAATATAEKYENTPQGRIIYANSIFRKITENYKVVFESPTTKITAKERDWYKNMNVVLPHLTEEHNIPKENIQKYVIDHSLDTMDIEQKLVLLSAGFDKNDGTTETEMEIRHLISGYFEKRTVKRGRQTAILLVKNSSWELFIKPNEEKEMGTEWEEGEPTDKEYFVNEIRNKFDVEYKDGEINNIIGFINLFRNNEMVFKTKDLRNKINTTGVYCGQSQTKSDVIKILNELYRTNTSAAVSKRNGQPILYETTVKIFQQGLCVILELLLRHKQDIKENGRIYFFTPEETVLNEVPRMTV